MSCKLKTGQEHSCDLVSTPSALRVFAVALLFGNVCGSARLGREPERITV